MNPQPHGRLLHHLAIPITSDKGTLRVSDKRPTAPTSSVALSAGRFVSAHTPSSRRCAAQSQTRSMGSERRASSGTLDRKETEE